MEGLSLRVNGQLRSIDGAQPHTTLLGWLRSEGLTGCKEGCAEGECGACAVLLARPGAQGQARWQAVNACLVMLPAVAGQDVITAEGLGTPQNLHPAQRELAVRGGSQCGYCTPGFAVSMAAEYYRPERQAQEADHEHGPNGFDLHAISGNLCRCTGYRPIQDAAYALAFPEAGDPLAEQLKEASPLPQALTLRGETSEFERPADLQSALEILSRRPDAKLLAGGTDWGVDVNLKHARAGLTLAIDHLPELREVKFSPECIAVGAGLSLSELERQLGGKVALLSTWFAQFASPLIRNSATLGGNLATASPIGDSPPALLALNASVVLSSLGQEREVALSEFFKGYRQTALQPGELIRAVKLPLPLLPISAFYKITKRRFDDISSVAVGLALKLDNGRVAEVRIGLGGVAATPLRACRTEQALRDQPWNEQTARSAAQLLKAEGTPLDDHRASAAYRAAMLEQALLKFYFANPRAGGPT